MNGTADVEAHGPELEERLDPSSAAALLEQTRASAHRAFQVGTPTLALVRAVVVLVIYGILWISVRGQHPYKGPTGPALVAVIGVLGAAVLVTVVLLGRSLAGVSGRSLQRRRAMGLLLVAGYAAVFMVEGAMAHAGVGDGTAYGTWAASGPLLVVGALAGAYAAMQEDWTLCGVGACLMLLGGAATFAGPVGVWETVAFGGFGIFVAQAAVQSWLNRR